MQSAKVKAFWVAAGIALFGALANCRHAQEVPLGERFPGPWVEDVDIGISKALASAGVGGCGQLKYRPSPADAGEYLVHCSRDGQQWTAYFVWVPSGKVSGPFTPSIQ